MNNFLVVGMDGTIGAALFAHLQLMGKSVYGSTYRDQKSDQKNIFHLNLSDNPSLWDIPPVKFCVVYICAGICSMSLCDENPDLTRKINVIGITKLAHYFSDIGSFVVFLSTNQVFSGDQPLSLTSASYQPINEYGRQKAEVETFIKTTCKQHAIVRLTKVIKPNMPILKNWVDKLLSDESIEVFHDMMFAPVTLQYVIELLVAIGDKGETGCYQLSGPEDISYYQAANYIADLVGRRRSLIHPVSALERGIKIKYLPRFTTLDCSSIIAHGWRKPPHYSEVIKESVGIIL